MVVASVAVFAPAAIAVLTLDGGLRVALGRARALDAGAGSRHGARYVGPRWQVTGSVRDPLTRCGTEPIRPSVRGQYSSRSSPPCTISA